MHACVCREKKRDEGHTGEDPHEYLESVSGLGFGGRWLGSFQLQGGCDEDDPKTRVFSLPPSQAQPAVFLKSVPIYDHP